ncbi:MAG: ABC transporter permease [Anaerolineales bacterium]|jgi:ABC-2 type transport system permease protein
MSVIRAITHNLRIFFQGAYLSYIALFNWLRPVTYMASKVIMPLNQILFFTFLGISATGRDSAGFYIIGNAVQIAAVSGIYGVTFSIGGERWTGTLGYLFGTPANRMFLFLGRAFFHILDGMLGVVLGFMWGVVLLGLDLSNTDFIALGLTIVITTISTSGLGLLMGCLSLITRNIMFVNNTVYFLLLVLSGANIPLEVFPNTLQSLSYALPLTRGIQASRILIDGGSLTQVSRLLMGELIVGLAYASVGYFLFRWFEMQAKRMGSLEVF